jgi:hypothetical protein
MEMPVSLSNRVPPKIFRNFKESEMIRMNVKGMQKKFEKAMEAASKSPFKLGRKNYHTERSRKKKRCECCLLCVVVNVFIYVGFLLHH